MHRAGPAPAPTALATVVPPDTSNFPAGSSVGTTRAVQMTIAVNRTVTACKSIPVTKAPAKACALDKEGKKTILSIEAPTDTISVTHSITKTTPKENK